MLVNSALLTTTLASIATAVPNIARAGPHGGSRGAGTGGVENSGGSCNANALCCDNVGSYNQLQDLLGGLVVGLDALTGNLGVGCIDLDIVDLLGDNSCNAQAVCCEGTTFSNVQLIGLNCDPIDIL
ncbi:hypothetical protein BKA82DRAFT_4515331 [Pisolithus tinctorius]|nr:hypothetical protein BKA82DRAFT_4515331 [Pisolithus tinctorius]